MALAMLPVAAFAQSTYEPIGGIGSQAEQKAGISVDELLAAGKETAEEKGLPRELCRRPAGHGPENQRQLRPVGT